MLTVTLIILPRHSACLSHRRSLINFTASSTSIQTTCTG